jgi:spore maturation protein CgeB
MIYRLRQYRIVQTIYIVSSEKNAVDYFTSTIDDVTVFQDKDSMFDRLEPLIDHIQREKFEGGLFTTFNRKEKALKDIRQELAAFVLDHIFKGP